MNKETPQLGYFPLQVFILPGEQLQLTVFEPRYKQLISDCLEEKLTFGIPYAKDDTIGPYGIEVRLKEVLNTYANGELEIIVEGVRIFKLASFSPVMTDKLYAGGEVEWVDLDVYESFLVCDRLYQKWLELQDSPSDEMRSANGWMDMAIQTGLDAEQKMHLIGLPAENRENYLKGQMEMMVAVLRQEKELGERIVYN